MYAHLLIDLFRFLGPFLRNVELTKSIQILYRVIIALTDKQVFSSQGRFVSIVSLHVQSPWCALIRGNSSPHSLAENVFFVANEVIAAVCFNVFDCCHGIRGVRVCWNLCNKI